MVMGAQVNKFQKSAFIRLNTEEIQRELRILGYEICPCSNFKNAVWLSTFPQNGSVHGIGFTDDTYPLSVEEELNIFLRLNNVESIDCGENIDLFYHIAALRNDSDNKQVFTNGKGDWGIYYDEEEGCVLQGIDFSYMPKDINMDNYHKASVEELIELFKNE